MTRVETVTFYCTNKARHAPVHVYSYTGPIPPPEGHYAVPRTTFSLDCDPKKGGCGREPRPGDEEMRRLIESLADTPGRVFDISFWDR